jgi:hypothetical protein
VKLKTLGYAFGAGGAAFLLVGVAVTELDAQQTEFSVFLGIPAGLIAAVVAVLAVLLGLADGSTRGRRRAVAGVAVFGVTFVGGMALAATVLAVPVLVSMLVSAGVSLTAAVVAALLAGLSFDGGASVDDRVG